MEKDKLKGLFISIESIIRFAEEVFAGAEVLLRMGNPRSHSELQTLEEGKNNFKMALSTELLFGGLTPDAAVFEKYFINEMRELTEELLLRFTVIKVMYGDIVDLYTAPGVSDSQIHILKAALSTQIEIMRPKKARLEKLVKNDEVFLANEPDENAVKKVTESYVFSKPGPEEPEEPEEESVDSVYHNIEEDDDYLRILFFVNRLFDYYSEHSGSESADDVTDYKEKVLSSVSGMVQGFEPEKFSFAVSFLTEDEVQYLDFFMDENSLYIVDGGAPYEEGAETYTNWFFTLYGNGERDGELRLDIDHTIDLLKLGATIKMDIMT